MRPSLDIDPGLFVPPSQRSGTGRHTLPDTPASLLERSDRISLGGMADEFFSVGDAGDYEGGPARVEAEPEAAEVVAAPVKVVQRTPEMDARRARLARVVATVVGCFAAVLALGVVRANASEKVEAEPVTAAEAVRAPERSSAPAAVVVEAPAPPAVPEATPPRVPERAAPTAARPAPAFAAAPARVAPPVAQAPAVARVVPAPGVTALPSVANFAARAGEPAKSAGRVPTASFAPAQ